MHGPTPKKMTWPMGSKPRRPDRPAICLNCKAVRKRWSPAKTTLRQKVGGAQVMW